MQQWLGKCFRGGCHVFFCTNVESFCDLWSKNPDFSANLFSDTNQSLINLNSIDLDLDLWREISKSLFDDPALWGGISKSLFFDLDLCGKISKSLISDLDLWGEISKSLISDLDLWGKFSKFMFYDLNLWGGISKYLFYDLDLWGEISKSLISDLNLWRENSKNVHVCLIYYNCSAESTFHLAEVTNFTWCKVQTSLCVRCKTSLGVRWWLGAWFKASC